MVFLHDPQTADARWRRLVEQIPAVTYIADFDVCGTLQWVIPQIEALLGYPAEDFIAQPGLWYELVHPDDRARVIAEEARVYEDIEEIELEYRMIARDGRVLSLREQDTIVRDDEGRPLLTQGVVVDVTSLRRAEEALRGERDRAQSYLDVAGAIIVVLDRDGRIEVLNRAGYELLGYDDGALVDCDWFDTMIPPPDRTVARGAFRALMAGATDAVAETFEGSVLRSDGSLRTVLWRNSVMRDGDGRPAATLSSGLDTTERHEIEQQIAYLAYHDSLTGLPNRALLAEHLELSLARARRQSASVALLYLDLDDFKLVNDSLGHAAGDELLCQIAMRLADRRRETDLLARQGGDEFLVLLSDVGQDGVATAKTAAEAMLDALAQPFTIAGTEFTMGASIGIAVFPRDAADAEELLRHADAAMYQAKARGRNTVTLYSGDARQSRRRLSLPTRLSKATAREELVLHWQPIVDPRDGTLRRAEALVRWDDPSRGLVAPGDFIPFAEEIGLIDEIGEWVLGALCDQRLAWREQGVDPQVTFNVAPRELRRPSFAEHARGRLDAHGLDPGRVTIEVTECAAMSDHGTTEPVLRELVEAGFQVAIDDFGAGYSSLRRLRDLPVGLLKIDRSFLTGVPERPEATAVLTAMLELAGALGMQTVAVGVETEGQRAFLIERVCTLAQGFLLGRPVPARELQALLRRSPTRAAAR